MIVGVGTDIIEISRIKKAILGHGFVNRVFTENEIAYYQSKNKRVEILAGDFAVKEAVVKALGIGFVGIGLKDIEVLRDTWGKPYVVLHNKAKTMIADNCIVHVSISHCREYATAISIIESTNSNQFDGLLSVSQNFDQYNNMD